MTPILDTRGLRSLSVLVLGSFLASCGATPAPSDPENGEGTGGTGGTVNAGQGGSQGGKTGKGGQGGQGGTSTPGSGGTTVQTPDAADPTPTADAADPTPTTDASATPTADGPVVVDPPTGGSVSTGPFTCTLVIGIASTKQWFDAGFEKLVDNAKYEVIGIHSGFIQNWADPNNGYWNTAPSSACAMNAKNPDHVIIEALYLHWMEATVEQWIPPLVAVVKNIKAKYPAIKRIELSTFPRAPGGKPCPASMPFKSFIRPEQDEAEAKVAAMFPDLVVAGPKFEVKSCADYGGNPPHFSGGGASTTAKMIADYYNGLGK